ncbi:cystatin-B-like [Anarhichas minor]|uniref:cystatin-B-like n=1 Tax=Anarhichas minor TaxID=65739 RepID=UPI003F73EF12
MAGLLGGYGETKAADKETQIICDQVKPEVEKETGKIYLEFKAVKYRFQVVAGSNYVIKVQVGGEDYIHLSLFQELPCNGGKVVVRGVQLNKTKEVPLIPFP